MSKTKTKKFCKHRFVAITKIKTKNLYFCICDVHGNMGVFKKTPMEKISPMAILLNRVVSDGENYYCFVMEATTFYIKYN
jgi:hypothetical protein